MKAHLLIQRFEDREGATYAIAPETKLPDGVSRFSKRIFVAHPQGTCFNLAREKALVCLLMGVENSDEFTWEFVK